MPTFTALIVEGAGSISGDVKIQRYIPDAVIGHHYLSSPMTSILLSELSDDFSFELSGAYPNIYLGLSTSVYHGYLLLQRINFVLGCSYC